MVVGSATEDSAAPTHSRTWDWLARSVIPTLVPTSVVTGCKLCLRVWTLCSGTILAFFHVFIVFFWSAASGGSNTPHHLPILIPTAFGTIPIVKPFRVRTPPQCVYSIIQYPRTDFPNWHTRLLPSHTLTVLRKTPPPHPHYSTCLLLSGLPFFILLVDTLYRVSSSVVQIICLHLHHPSRSRSFCFIVNRKAICLLSVVILIYSRLLLITTTSCMYSSPALTVALSLGQLDYFGVYTKQRSTQGIDRLENGSCW